MQYDMLERYAISLEHAIIFAVGCVLCYLCLLRLFRRGGKRQFDLCNTHLDPQPHIVCFE
ncbi:ORF5a [African pouched rat arterivirus]|uniref:ORF5a n=1 Tax=African pouched rat arterivirus TaxID=1965064 RepID=A0A0B5JSP2_9NIDO|nr:ORF5a [African pouched rat arterivirus]AJG06164.1 ORF5a [African pouched rat arterivirus]